jgi:hypothetical protein
MQIEVPIVRQEILVVNGPSKSKLFLFLLDSLEVFIDCTIYEFQVSAYLITADYFEGIFQKLVTKIGILE